MKFLWYIAAHERIEVTSMCYRGLHRVNDYARKQGHEVDVFIVCSDRIHQELAAAHGFYFSNIIPNEPLGRKMNLGLVEAMDLDFDYIVQSGTDNLYTSNLLTFYADKIKQSGFEFFGLNKIYFYDFYRHIAKLALNSLRPKGSLYFEINQYLGKDLQHMLEMLGFENVELKKDIYGADRMIRAVKI